MSLVFREKNEGSVTEYTIAPGTTPFEFTTAKAKINTVISEKYGPMFFIDGTLQAAHFDEYIYHEFLVHPAMMNCERPRSVCILGGSDGCALREILKWNQVEKVTLIDWDEELVQYFKQNGKLWHQGAHQDPRVSYMYADIRSFFDVPVREKYDVLFVDLLDPVYADVVEENGFWQKLLDLVQSMRNLGGTIVINSGGVLPWKYETFYSLFKRTLAVFRDCHVQPYKVFVPSFQEDWAFLLIYKDELLVDLQKGVLTRRLNKKTFMKATSWEPEYHPRKSSYEVE